MAGLSRYRRLDEAQIALTLRALHDRIEHRFPGSGLSQVSAELVQLGDEASVTVAFLRRPLWAVRAAAGAAIAGMVTIVGLVVIGIKMPGRVDRLNDLVSLFEGAINDIVFLGIAIFFLATLEGRIKRRRALQALHQLRSVVHIVDMHQLTKDPERLTRPDTGPSPARMLRGPDLGRYLDFCSELLSLTSKIAALFVQHLSDPVVLSTVNEIEALVTGLSGKIWQKIALLEGAGARHRLPSPRDETGA